MRMDHHSFTQIQTNLSDRQPIFSVFTSGWSSRQNFFLRKCIQTPLSSSRCTRRKKRCAPKMKANRAQKIVVKLINQTKYAYLVVKLSKLRNMNIFMAYVRQKWARMYFLQKGQQQMASPRYAPWTADTPTMAETGVSQQMVMTRAMSIFLRQLKNQKYLVSVLQLVLIRYMVGVKEQSRIHSGFIISSLALSSNKTSSVISRARNRAEKKAPVVAKPELKVRLATWVKMLMLIYISEKQKKMMRKLNQRMLYSLLTTQQTEMPQSLWARETQYHYQSPLICD